MISRRIGDRIVIGDSVEITITEIHRSSVRLAIKSTPGTVVLRGEVRDAIEAANKMAAMAPLDNQAIESLAQFDSNSIRPISISSEVAPTTATPLTAAPAAATVSHSK